MGIYLLKFTACLAVLYFFYNLFLENENMHTFKRFYLLASLTASLIIPAIVFTEYVEVAQTTNIPASEYTIPLAADGPISTPMELGNTVLDIAPILYTVYVIGVLFFGLKFLKNLFQILRRVRNNPKQRWEHYIHVLLKDPLPPHTFFSYIFLNKQKFEAEEIPKEVLLHEQTHAKQKHSYDILFVEFLQVVFWINPFVFLIKKSIKLNHEFLADQAVLNKNVSKNNYQNTLLSYLSMDSENNHQSPLVNPINYSSIKKRFKIMKTQTSKRAVILRSILLLPLFSILLFGFSETTTIEVQTDDKSVNTSNIESTKAIQQSTPNDDSATIHGFSNFDSEGNLQEIVSEIIVNINETGELSVQDDVVEMENLTTYLAKINPNLSKQEREQLVRAVVFAPVGTPEKLIDRIDAAFMEYGVATINIVGPEMEVKITGALATPEQVAEYNKLAKHYNSMSRNKMKIYKKDVERLEYLFSIMSEKQKNDAEPFPDFPEPPPAPKAPKGLNEREEAAHIIEEIIEKQDPYDVVNSGIRINSKGKKIVFPENSRVYIYNSDKSPNTSSGLINYVTSNDLKDAQFYFEGEKISSKKGLEIIKKRKDIKVETIPHSNKQPEVRIYKSESKGTIPPPPHPPQAPKVLKGERRDIQPPLSPVVLKGTASSIPEPPMPPKPVAPLDHVIAMAKKDAKFLYEGKEISADKAIRLMKNNKDLNIDSRSTKGKRPVVNLSKSPFE
jgi:beta-lactamase regulating signal transducer with metallopeptidase domain